MDHSNYFPREFKEDHRCTSTPEGTEICLVYTPYEIQWYLTRRISDGGSYHSHRIDIKIPITYCPYCGIKLLC